MAKVTWLGEDSGTIPGPSFNMWNGVKFPKGKAVEVTDEHMLAKARGNQFYRVTEAKAAEPPPAKEPEHVKEPEKPVAAAKVEKPDVAKGEKASGYSPVKKKVKKPKAAAERHAHR